jgi:hypothetical protein
MSLGIFILITEIMFVLCLLFTVWCVLLYLTRDTR